MANIALHTREKLVDVLTGAVRPLRPGPGREPALQILLQPRPAQRGRCPPSRLQFASISEIFGGSVLVEQVFSYPGLGQAAVTAGLGGDSALLAGIAVVSAVIVFGGNLIANILYGIIDPRIRRGEVSARGGEAPAA